MTRIVAALVCLASAAQAAKAAEEPGNLALKAKATASSQYGADYGASRAIDGRIADPMGRADGGRAWVAKGNNHPEGVTFTLEWPEPILIGEIVYFGRTAWQWEENWKGYEVRLDGAAAPAAKGTLQQGHGPQRIRLAKPAEARRLEITFRSSYGGSNPGAAEIQVYAAGPPDAVLGKFYPPERVPASAAAYKTPAAGSVQESPELLAALKAGKFGFTKMLVIQRNHIACTHVYTYHAEGQKDGGGLYVYDLPTGSLRQILDSSKGQILSYDLSFDGQELLVAWRQGGHYQIYRMNVDGSNLKQLTEGDHDNFDPVWLPDGDIAFLSTRTPLVAYCWTSYCGVVHRMKPDGSNVERISFNYLNDFTPSLMNDGRLLYGRWEYVDRPAIPIQGLWALNPDGTKLEEWFGNRVLGPATFIEARAVPGSSVKVLCTMTGHNGTLSGAVGLLDRQYGLNAQASIRNLTPEINAGSVRDSNNGPRGPYMTPYPLDQNHYLVSRAGTIYIRDMAVTSEARILPVRDGMIFTYAQPLRPRPAPPVRRSHSPEEPTPWATVYVQDVYGGLEPYVKRGEIKRIMVVEELAKPSIGKSTGFGFQRPVVSCGATYVPKKVWGFANVTEDGSAAFQVPAQTPIYFLPLDEKGRVVQRMRTFTHLAPGEVQGCVGCHDSHVKAPSVLPTRQSLRRPVQTLTPPEWGVRGFSYASIVQPVLDRHCTKCHNARSAPKNIDLSGDRTKWFNVSYDVLAYENSDLKRGGSPYVSWISTMNGAERNILEIAPKTWGSPKSKLADIVLSGHPDQAGMPRVNLSANERQRILAWIDLNAPYYGTSVTNHPEFGGGRALDVGRRLDEALAKVAARRCAECHAGGKLPPGNRLRITNPENNAFLLAPLAAKAGGTEACGKVVFASKDDPDYQAILKAFEPVLEQLKVTPRMDMVAEAEAVCPTP